MGYRVEVTDAAAAEIDNAYEWIKEGAPDAAVRWYDGLMSALSSLRDNPRSSLRDNPRRCARVRTAVPMEPEIRQLIYGRRRARYRVLFAIHDDTVEVLHVRHGARAPIGR